MRRMAGTRVAPWRFRWVAVGYLVLVAGVAVYVYLASWGALHDSADGASFAGVWLFVVTAPASAVLLALDPQLTGVAALAPYVAAGLVQAAVLYVLCRRLDRRRA
jgi:hypothetical protein